MSSHGKGSKKRKAAASGSTATMSSHGKGKGSKKRKAAASVVKGKAKGRSGTERRICWVDPKTQKHLLMTVAITGAHAGAILAGAPGKADSRNVVLQVAEGGTIVAPVRARRDLESAVGHDIMVASVSKHFGVSKAVAEQRLADMPVSKDEDAANHRPLGAGCNHNIAHGCSCRCDAEFVILQQGVWQSFADERGNGARLEKWVKDGTQVTWRDVLGLMHAHGRLKNKTLILRPSLYVERTSPGAVDAATVAARRAKGTPVVDVTVLTDGGGDGGGGGSGGGASAGSAAKVFAIGAFLVRLPPSAPGILPRTEVLATVRSALRTMTFAPAPAPAALEACVDELGRLSTGALKSAMQKAIRLGSKTMRLARGSLVPTPVYAALACGCLFADAGGFSPELQLFTRGVTAAAKRLAVVCEEDAWPDAMGVERKMLALLGLALATQRLSTWHPPRAMIRAVVRLTALAAMSPFACARPDAVRRQAATPGHAVLKLRTVHVETMAVAARLLRTLRSFQGDMNMFDEMAKQAAAKKGRIGLYHAVNTARAHPVVAPTSHIVDQHVFRGIGHLIRMPNEGEEETGSKKGKGKATTTTKKKGGSTTKAFKPRFTFVFLGVTGRNPRVESCGAIADFDDAAATAATAAKATGRGWDKRRVAKAVRFAQTHILRLALKTARMELERSRPGATCEIRYPLDAGVLAAAVGPVEVKLSKTKASKAMDVLVLLGVRTPSDEIVMAKPSRTPDPDLYKGVTAEQRARAIAQVRGRTLAVRSPLLQRAGKASFHAADEQWHLDGRPWEDVVGDGLAVTVPLLKPPAWSQRISPALLDDDAAVADALSVVGAGVVDGAEAAVKALCRSVPDKIRLRALSMLRQQYVTVRLPVPGLDGGLGSDQLMAYDGDWRVYRLLVLMSRLVPGALRPEQVPRFVVKNAVLLRALERWMQAVPPSSNSAAAAAAAAGSGKKKKEGKKKANPWLAAGWDSKAEAAREKKLMAHQRAAVARMEQRDASGVPGHFVVMDTGLGKTLTALHYAHRWLQRHGHRVDAILWVTPNGTIDNLVQQLKEQWRVPVRRVPRVTTARHRPGPGEARSFVAVKCAVNVVHADHLRTAIDAGLAAAAPRLLCVFDEVDTMYAESQRTSAARRLARMCPMFVAQTATPMTKKAPHFAAWLADTENFPVTDKNFLVAASGMVSMQLELGIRAVEATHVVPMAAAVRESYRALHRSRNWGRMAAVTQAHTDDAMCAHAANLAREDRRVHAAGGVLVVANDAAHGARLVDKLNALGVKAGGFDAMQRADAATFACVVVPKTKDRGYNTAARLGAIVSGAYAGNASSRHQMRGRIRRIGQVRQEVEYVTVVMANSILQLLHERHHHTDSMNMSLEQLGQSWACSEAMREVMSSG